MPPTKHPREYKLLLRNRQLMGGSGYFDRDVSTFINRNMNLVTLPGDPAGKILSRIRSVDGLAKPAAMSCLGVTGGASCTGLHHGAARLVAHGCSAPAPLRTAKPGAAMHADRWTREGTAHGRCRNTRRRSRRCAEPSEPFPAGQSLMNKPHPELCMPLRREAVPAVA